MTITHCIGIDLGTSTTKIVIRDLEFDEVRPVTYQNGEPVILPSFVAVNSSNELIILPPENLNAQHHWRFENLKGKLLYPKDFKTDRKNDNSVISLMEGCENGYLLGNDLHYRCFLTLKLSYLMRRVLEWGSLDCKNIRWSLPVPVNSLERHEALVMAEIFSKAIIFSNDINKSKSSYLRAEYKKILGEFTKSPARINHHSLQILPEGICNIVAIAAASFRRAERFALIDIGASTAEFLAFSFDLEGNPCVYHSRTFPIGVESLKSCGQLSIDSDLVVLGDEARAKYTNYTVEAIVNPSRVNLDYYRNIRSVELDMCGGGSLIPIFGEVLDNIPLARFESYKAPKPTVNKDFSMAAEYDHIPVNMLPRYLVACGLSVLIANFGNYKLPLDLAKQFKEIRCYIELKPYSNLEDNWDYTAIK
jgi:hypothetical protein